MQVATNHKLFHTSVTLPKYLTYIEWFSWLSAAHNADHLMYKVMQSTHNGGQSVAIIPVELILCSVHLIPQIGPTVPQNWSVFLVLERCHTFFINPFSDRYNYLIFSRQIIDHLVLLLLFDIY